jgi:hypothetical protein
MELTNEQIEAIKAAARPIKYGSVTIHIGEVNRYLEIEALEKTRVAKETGTAQEKKKFA